VSVYAAQKLDEAAEARVPWVAMRLRRARESLGWTQKELSDRLGVCRSTVSAWERGKRTPGETASRKLRELAKEVGS